VDLPHVFVTGSVSSYIGPLPPKPGLHVISLSCPDSGG
jgi:hypothetical protein